MRPTQIRDDDVDTPDSVGYFNRLSHDYAANLNAHPGFGERFALFEAWLARIEVYAAEPLTCVDLGCGPGTLSIAAARLGYRVVAIDGSTKMLEIAAENAERQGITLELHRHALPLDADALDALAAGADVVIASSVIEYMHDQERFISQCRQLLRPGGIALVSFANAQSVVRRAERRLRHTRLYRGSILEVQQHRQRERDARRLFEAAGLGVVGVSYFSMPAPVYGIWRSNRRPPWLATMFLLAGRR